MARRVGALAGAVAALAVLSACPSSRHATPSTPTSARPAPAPGSGPVVRVAMPEEPASLNPFDVRSRTLAAQNVLQVLLPKFFAVDPEGRVRGDLVDDTTVRERTRSVRFSLRRDVKWSDGQPITADDVRFTLDAIRSPAWPGPRFGYDAIRAVEGTGATVTLRFSSPVASWKRLFSAEEYVLPAHRLRGVPDLQTVWAGGPDVAGGPFVLAGVTPGLEVDLDRNPQWWGAPVATDRVRVLVVPDARTQEQLLGRGEVDVAAPGAGTARTPRLRAVPGVSVNAAGPGGLLTSLVANTQKLAAARRRALLGLVDRDRFVTVLLAGEAVPAVSLAPEPGGNEGNGPWAHVSASDRRDGLGETFTATFAAPDSEPMAGLLGRAMQTRLEGEKATLDLAVTAGSEVNADWRPSGRFDLLLTTEVQWPQPCWRCRFGAQAVASTNWSRAGDLDDLATAADGGQSGSVAALEQRLRADAVMLPVWRPDAVVASRGLRGVAANPWAPGPLWDAASWTPAH